MDDEQWTRDLAARWSEQLTPAREDEFDLLASLAEDPANGLLELAPGVWIVDRHGWGSTN